MQYYVYLSMIMNMIVFIRWETPTVSVNNCGLQQCLSTTAVSDHLAKSRPVSSTITRFNDHSFAGCAPPKFNNDATFVY